MSNITEDSKMKINVNTALHQEDVIALLEKQESPSYKYLGMPVGFRTTLQFEVDEDECPEEYEDILEYTKAIIKKEPWSLAMQCNVTKALF